jgi:DNA polymerase-3 subunit delta
MKIPPQTSEQFLECPPSNIKAVLFYGPDTGLIAERALKLTKAVIGERLDAFRLDEIDYDKIKANSTVLAEKIGALSFSGGRRVIRIKTCAASLPMDIQAIIKQYEESAYNDCLIIVTADDLPPASSTRKFFEGGKQIASLACYKDEALSARKVIGSTLKEAGFSFDANVLTIIEQAGQGDRLLLRSEIEKLLLYMQDCKHITAQDAMLIAATPAMVELDQLVFAVGRCDAVTSHTTLTRLLLEGTQVIAIIRALLRHFTRMHLVRVQLDQRISETEAVKSLSPPLFFKSAAEFMAQLRNWPETQLLAIIQILLQCEIKCKQSKMPANMLLTQLLSQILLHPFR